MDISRVRKLRTWKKGIVIIIIGFFLVTIVGNKQGVSYQQKKQQNASLNQENECEKVGHYFNGYYYDIVIKDDFAFIASFFSGLVILDVSNKTNPTQVFSEEIYGETKFVELEGNYLYLLVRDYAILDCCLVIYDISSPSNPIKISVTNLFQNIYGINDFSVENHYVYLTYYYGLLILDAIDPAAPVIIFTTLLDDPGHLFLQDDLLFISESYHFGITVYNVSTPASPEHICQYNGSDDGLSSEYGFISFYVDGDFLYGSIYEGFLVINITNPTNLTLSNHIELEDDLYYRKIAISGDYIYLLSSVSNVTILHKNNFTHPLKVGEYDFIAINLIVEGNFLYLIFCVLQIIDVTDPTNPNFVGQFGDESIRIDAEGIDIQNDYVYLACKFAGLKILDISDLTNPIKVGEYVTERAITQVIIIGDFAYLKEGSHSLVILDVSDPTNPVKVSEYQTFEVSEEEIDFTTNFIREIFAQENYLYIVTYNCLLILDVSNPETPEAVGVYTHEDYIRSAYVVDEIAYIAYKNEIQTINVEDKTNPYLIKSYIIEDISYFNKIAISGKYAFVVSSDSLEVLNVGNPSNIKHVNSIPLDIRTIHVAGQYVCLAGTWLFELYDMVNPNKPVNITTYWDSESSICIYEYEGGARIKQIIAKDNYAFLAYGSNGFVIIRLPFYMTGSIKIEYKFLTFSLITVSFIAIVIHRKRK